MARLYNRRYKMTPVIDRKRGMFRWVKKYKGFRRHFNYSRADHDKAWEECKAWMAEIDSGTVKKPDRSLEDEYRRIIEIWQDAQERASQEARDNEDRGLYADAEGCTAVLAHLVGLVSNKKASLPDASRFDFHLYDCLEMSPENSAVLDEFWPGGKTKIEPSKTLGGNVPEFLKYKRRQVASGDITPRHYDNLRRGIEEFGQFAGSDRLLADVGPQLLIDYQTHVVASKGKKTGKRLSAHSARDKIDVVKQFLRVQSLWCA